MQIKSKKEDKKSNQELKMEIENVKNQPINFKQIFLLDNKELIYWCIEAKILRKPSCCPSCRKRTNERNAVRLSGCQEYIDKYVWRCTNKDCTLKQNIRLNNLLLESFSRVKLRILFIYIFTHFSVMLPPIASSKTLGLSLKTIRNISNPVSTWIVRSQIYYDLVKGKFGGKNFIIEMDESCFF